MMFAYLGILGGWPFFAKATAMRQLGQDGFGHSWCGAMALCSSMLVIARGRTGDRLARRKAGWIHLGLERLPGLLSGAVAGEIQNVLLLAGKL